MANQSMYLGSQLVPFAQVLGVTGAAMLSGLIVSASYVSVPVIAMAPPDLMAKQWAATYSIGKATAPPIAVTCSICFAFLASQCISHHLPVSKARADFLRQRRNW